MGFISTMQVPLHTLDWIALELISQGLLDLGLKCISVETVKLLMFGDGTVD